MNSCPSAATLARFVTDSLGGPAYAAIEEHIEACPECQAELERLAVNDRKREAPSFPGRDELPSIPGFDIKSVLGRGGMGVVYRAFQPSLNREVALKVVLSGPTAGSSDRTRWLREARALARVRHPNIVSLYEAGEAGGWLYLVLEFVPGGMLKDRLDKPCQAKEAARLLEKIAGAVALIHRAKLLHLDLKPSNILLDPNPESTREPVVPRVSDFGLARRWDASESSLPTASLAGPIGTPSYMAPEQVEAECERLGPAADIYGLGALLYHALTGRPPFSASSTAETLEQVRHQEPVPPRRLNPSIPRDLETICLRCLQKDLGRRYATADEMADDLRRWQAGRPIMARPVSIAERTWRACLRRPAVAALASALLVSLCSGFLGMFLLWKQAEGQRDRAEVERVRAEAAHARSEADFAIANELLDRLVDLSTGGRGGSSQVVGPERLIDMLGQIRTRMRELTTRRSDQTASLRRMSLVVNRLYNVLMQERKWAAARSLLESCISDRREELRRNPSNDEALHWLGQYLQKLGEVASQEGKSEESILHLREALLRTEESRRRPVPDIDPILAMAYSRDALAMALARRGDLDGSRALLLANRRMFDELPAETDSIFVAAWRIRVRSDFIRLMDRTHPAPMTDMPVGEPGGNDPLSKLSSPDANRVTATAWAELAVDALSPANQSTRLHELRVELFVCHHLATTASQLRRLGRLDEAKLVADRLLAFGRLVVNRYPDSPDTHLVLSEAYIQLNKNAWQINDWPAIQRNLELAIEVNRQALSLDPNHEVARSFMEQRQRKLKKFLSLRRIVVSPNGAERSTSPAGS
jgi:tetratricopeptide (TPR) repeat protein